MIKQTLALFAAMLAFSASRAQEQEPTWLRENYVKQEIRIPMRDGTRLFTVVFSPKNAKGKHPILLERSPYSCAPYGEGEFPKMRASFAHYLRQGYIIVKQDVRGRWMSEGTFVDVRPYNPAPDKNDTDETTDTYDTIDWLVKNVANNNGNVGVSGISYPGFYSTMAS